MTWTSLFCRAVGSCVASVMTRKITLDRCGLAPQYLSFGTSVTDWLFTNFEILNGPAVQVGTVSPNHLYDEARPAGVLVSPCWAARCAGYIAPEELHSWRQSVKGLENVTVTVLPLSEPT